MKFKIVTFSLLLSFLTLSEVQSHHSQDMDSGESHYVDNSNYMDENYMGENYMDDQHSKCQKTGFPVIKINCIIEIPKKSKKYAHHHQSIGRSKIKYYDSTNFIYNGIKVNVSYDLYYSKRSKFSCHVHTEEPPDVSHCECGKKNEKKKDPTRIVGGEETGVNEYPMMAGLVDNGKKELYCGATIIRGDYVLTAAHCVDRRDPNTIGVLVGDHNLTTGEDTSAAKVYRINNCIMHPKYNDFNNDIAVCKTSEPMQYSAEVGPVCLPFHHRCNSFTNSNVTMSGWGMLEYGGKKATTLQEVNVTVISNQECKERLKDMNITDCHICTYTPGKDACQMDSGGPLLWQDNKTNNLAQVGIIAAGEGCAWDKPAINTRVGCYVDWIQCVTGEKYCKVE